MADQDGLHSAMNTQLLRHVTLSPHDVDVKGDIFRRAMYPPSLVVIASTYILGVTWGAPALTLS